MTGTCLSVGQEISVFGLHVIEARRLVEVGCLRIQSSGLLWVSKALDCQHWRKFKSNSAGSGAEGTGKMYRSNIRAFRTTPLWSGTLDGGSLL